MLAKKDRLSGKADFDKVKKEGKVIQSDSFGLAFLDRKDEGLAKFGFVISTKVAKEATKRNKAKRSLSEGVRLLLSNVKSGFTIVFLAKRNILNKERDQVINEVEEALRKAALIK